MLAKKSLHLIQSRSKRLATYLWLLNILLAPQVWSEQTVKLSTLAVYANHWDSLSTQSYSGEDIRARFQTIDQFLTSITGLQVQHSGGLGDPVLLSVRGGTSNQTTVLIDGIRLNESQSGSYDLSTIALGTIERIELSLRGSNGGQYDQAIGGTINIITRKDYRQTALQLGLGSFGYRHAAYRQALTSKLSLYADTQQSLNNYDYPVPTPWDGSKRYSEESLNNAEFYRHQALLTLNENLLTARLRWLKQNKQIPDYFRNNPNNNAHFEKSEWAVHLENADAAQASSAKSTDSNQGWQLGWQVSHQATNENFSDPDGYIGLGEDEDHYTSHHSELSLQPVWRSSNVEINSALNIERDDYQSRYLNDNDSEACLTLQGSCDQNAIQRTINISTGGLYQPSDNWRFSTNGYYRAVASQNRRASAEDAQRQKKQNDFSGFSASVSRLFTNAQIQLSARQSVRIPSLYERYGDRGLMLGNDDLQAETATTLSLDSEWYLPMHTLRASVFKRHLDNAIVPVYDSRGIGRYENTSSADLTGIEVVFDSQFQIQQVQITPVIGISHYATHTDSTVRSFNNQQLSGIYHGRYTAAVTLDYKKHKAGINYELAGDLYLDRSNINKGDSRQLISASYGYQQHHWNADLSISNLTNNTFRDYSNRPIRGRSINLSTEFRF